MSAGRLFLGTFLPEADRRLLAGFRDLNDRLSAHWQGRLRWIHPDKLHLTWYFIGSVDEDKFSEVAGSVDAALKDTPPVQLCYDSAEMWPNGKWPRQFVLAATARNPSVLALFGRLEKSVKKYAEKEETRKFNPHITLLRFDRKVEKTAAPREIPDWLGLSEVFPLVHKVDKVMLIRSYLGKSDGKAYEPLYTWQL